MFPGWSFHFWTCRGTVRRKKVYFRTCKAYVQLRHPVCGRHHQFHSPDFAVPDILADEAETPTHVRNLESTQSNEAEPRTASNENTSL